MAKVEFTRVETDAEVENIDIKDGQLIYTGTGKTYMDYGTERIPTGSGGGSEVVIDDEQPTGDDWKLWIDSDEVINSGSEVVDSLEGNETNKAPSVRTVKEELDNKINDIDTKLHDYIITRNVDIQCREFTSVTASVPSGYKFLCWLQPASYGSIKAAYMEIYNNQTSNIWVVNVDSDLRHSFHCPYLCIRDI